MGVNLSALDELQPQPPAAQQDTSKVNLSALNEIPTKTPQNLIDEQVKPAFKSYEDITDFATFTKAVDEVKRGIRPVIGNTHVGELTGDNFSANHPTIAGIGRNLRAAVEGISTMPDELKRLGIMGGDEGLAKALTVPYNVGKMIYSGLSQPFIGGLKELYQSESGYLNVVTDATQNLPPHLKQQALDFYRKDIGYLDPNEAEEARRGFIAGAASLLIGGAAHEVASGLVGKTAATVIGTNVGVSTYAAMEKQESPEDKLARAAGYALIALPLGMATDALVGGLVEEGHGLSYDKKLFSGNSELPNADSHSVLKSVRLNDPVGTESTLRAKIADTIYPEGAAERRNLLRATETDKLTGLGNRDAFEKALPNAEADPGTSIVVFDGDNFGRINKDVSYETGDRALVEMSQAIKDAASDYGVSRVFRHGSGDEFSVIAPNDVASKIASKAEELYGKKNYGGVEVGLSGNFGDTFGEADAAMQVSKQLKKGVPFDQIKIGGNSVERMTTPEGNSVELTNKDEKGNYHFDINVSGKQTPISMYGTLQSDGTFNIANIEGDETTGAGTLGTAGARNVLRQIKQLAPEIKALTGERITGSRAVNALGNTGMIKNANGEYDINPKAIVRVELPDIENQSLQDPPANAVVDINKDKLQASDQAKNNLTESLVALHSIRQHKGGVTVVPGLTNPAETLRAIHNLIPEEQTIAIHQRADGLFDVAFGNKDSKLKGTEKQFSNYGYYEGQPVYVNGKDYLYKSNLNDTQSLISEPLADGVSKPIKVNTADLKRAADQVEVLARDYKIDDLKKILDEGTLKAYQKLIENPNLQATPDFAAASNNMRIERGPAGGFHVLDNATGKIVQRGFKTADEASAFVNRTGTTGGPPLDPPNTTGDVGSLIPPDEPNKPIEDMLMPRVGPIQSVMKSFDAAMTRSLKFLHIAHDRFIALDNRYPGLESFRMFTESQKLKQSASVDINNWHGKAKEIEKIAVDAKMDLADRKLVGEYIETASPEELSKKIGVDNLQFGERLARLGPTVSTPRAYAFIRQRNFLVDELSKGGKEPQSLDIYNIENQLAQTMKMSKEEMQAVRILEEAKKHPDVDMDIVARYANAVHDNTLSREDFAKTHNFKPEMIVFAQRMSRLFDEAAGYLGIDKLKFYGYLQHARSHFSTSDLGSAFLGKPNLEKDFISELSRTGEVTGYNLDPVTNFANYIHQGIMTKQFNKPFSALVKEVEGNMKQLGLDVEKSEPGEQIQSYIRDVKGLPGRFDSVINDAVTKMVQTLPWFKDTSVNVLKDLIDPITDVTNFDVLGFRPGMGIRHLVDGIKKYWYKMGSVRTTNMIRMAASNYNVDELKADGVIVGLDRHMFTTAAETDVAGVVQKQPGMIKRGFNATTETGLKASLLPAIYEKLQAGIYLETLKHVTEQLKNLSLDDGLKGKNDVYDKIGLFKFDDPVRQRFDEYVNAGDKFGAADYLGRMNIYDVIGRYGLGNNSWGGRTIFGRLALNLGTWAMQTKGYIARGATVGTKADRLGFMARMAVGESALTGFGAATGLNLRTWTLAHAFPFAGGPLFQLGLQGINSSKQGTNFTNDLERLATPQFLKDWDQALNDNNVDTPVKFLGRLSGIPTQR